jgi:hypothetical protein
VHSICLSREDSTILKANGFIVELLFVEVLRKQVPIKIAIEI